MPKAEHGDTKTRSFYWGRKREARVLGTRIHGDVGTSGPDKQEREKGTS